MRAIVSEILVIVVGNSTKGRVVNFCCSYQMFKVLWKKVNEKFKTNWHLTFALELKDIRKLLYECLLLQIILDYYLI